MYLYLLNQVTLKQNKSISIGGGFAWARELEFRSVMVATGMCIGTFIPTEKWIQSFYGRKSSDLADWGLIFQLDDLVNIFP